MKMRSMGSLFVPGCGIFMQDNDPDLPGYYQKRKVTAENLEDGEEEENDELDGFEMVDDDYEEDGEGEDDEMDDEIKNAIEGSNSESESEFDWESDEWEDKEKVNDIEFDGFAPAGVGYGNATEKMEKKKRVSKTERKKIAREEAKKDNYDDVTVCARCHSMRNYGQVKNQAAENLLPDFDRLISTRLLKPMSNSSTTVVVMVVDCVDFDGFFPKRAAKSLFKVLQKAENDPKGSKNLPKLVLVATKVDLLPTQISPARLDRWVCYCAKAGGAPKLSGVYMVSARKDLGVKKMYDTPGLLHPYVMSLRLNPEEHKMIEIRKELQPRSYRVKASSLLLITV